MPRPTRMGLDAWKTLAASGEAPENTLLLKSYVAEVKAADDARIIDFTISTGSVDRDRDVIEPEGWKLAAFKRNNVVMWAHDYHLPPIARALRVKIEDGKLRASAEFVPAEILPFAETVYQLLKGGYLHAASVGFKPIKHVFNAERGGVDFQEQELLEFSIVPVPANAEALVDAKAAGIDIAPLQDWATAILKMADPGADALILREQDGAPVARQEGFEIQSVLFPKDKWDSAGACRDWLREHDFKTGDLDETGDHYRFRQRDPVDFQRMRTICLMPGRQTPMADCRVKAVGGPLKGADLAACVAAFQEDVTARLDGLADQLTRWDDRLAAREVLPESAVLALADEGTPDEHADGLEITEEDMRAALAGALGEIVATEVHSAMNALRGRVD